MLQMINLLSAMNEKWSKIIWYANTSAFEIWISNLYIFNAKSDVFAWLLLFVENLYRFEDVAIRDMGTYLSTGGADLIDKIKIINYFLHNLPGRNILSCRNDPWKL